MTRAAAKRRTQGSVRKRGRSFQVRVYAGVDPLTNKDIYLTETAPDEKEAQRVLRRLLTQVDEQRHARTKAPLPHALQRTPFDRAPGHWPARMQNRAAQAATRPAADKWVSAA